jgi:hypothetical protein
MKKEQAINIIKQTLDLAVKAGVFNNIDAAAVTMQAFQLINSIIAKDQQNETNE